MSVAPHLVIFTLCNCFQYIAFEIWNAYEYETLKHFDAAAETVF